MTQRHPLLWKMSGLRFAMTQPHGTAVLQSVAQGARQAQRLAGPRNQHDHDLGGKEFDAVAGDALIQDEGGSRRLLDARRHLQDLVDARGLEKLDAPCAARRTPPARGRRSRRSARDDRCRSGAGNPSGRARTSGCSCRGRRGRRNRCPRNRRGRAERGAVPAASTATRPARSGQPLR